MYQKAKPLFLICETPLHAGSGSDLGIVDLPIQRERHTSFPKIEGSSLKGALREAEEEHILKPLLKDDSKRDKVREELKKLNIVFGFDNGALEKFSKTDMENLFDVKNKNGEVIKGNTEFAGAIGFTDARLLLFPVKSMKGVFAWTTCPKVLRQFASDLRLAKVKDIPDLPQANTVATGSNLYISKSQKKVVLEEYTFQVEEDVKVANLGAWFAKHLFNDDNSYWCKKIKKDLIILTDDDFKDFVNLSTEVITRTKISNETGTVEAGALFTEEYLPAESVMYSLVLAHREFRKNGKIDADQVLDFFGENLGDIFQIGGSATIGKGLVRTGKSFFKTEKS